MTHLSTIRWRQVLSEFKGTTQPSEIDTTKATAHLPGLDIEIVHRRSTSGDAEQVSINLQAVPSFEAFGRYLEAVSPFAFWAEAMRLAWLPWFHGARAATLPWTIARALPNAAAVASRSSDKTHSSE